MVMANAERTQRAIGHLCDGLQPFCEQTWQGFYGDTWLNDVNQKLHTPDRDPSPQDLAFLLKGMKATWPDVFSQGFPNQVRAWVFEIHDVRNKHAHQESFTTDDTVRALDSMERLLEAFGAKDEQKLIKNLRRDLNRQLFEEEARSDRRKTASRPTESQTQAGLAPWREVITPHSDVAGGRFEQAEFAADLIEVANGDADEEYQDPEAFFRRTYLTEGLRKLLVGAAKRLNGQGGNPPVINLQTNFGGGKTHSMIALYHLASGTPAADLPGVGEMLADEELNLPADINRAVFVGQMVSPAAPVQLEEGVLVSTIWGHIAYGLGGKDGYEMVRVDDEAGTNPGNIKFKEVLERFSPAVVLIDEWVAYARQLHDGGDGPRLVAGDFDTQFTFAQTLTETAAAVDNVVVLISIPASDIEVGGAKGRDAMERLKNVVDRVATQWQPASPDEGFEIVRRRLFDPITPEQARIRDGVVGAFSEMYRTQRTEFPSGTSENDYRHRLEICYPVHPELFDRLFDDWSSLDKFQRTRGVLRLMASAISELWQRGDQSLLIMPGNLPIDSSPVVSELTKYLEEGWDPVIKSDVDGQNATPLKLDRANPHFGRLSATRRAARTVYMGSAPHDGKRGVDLKHILLGCVQPGEPAGQFADALRRLSGDATYLYVAGAQYWYSLQPNVTRVAADRAASNYTDRDADDEVKARIATQLDRGNFSAIQIFAEGPGDVPDDDGGVRLVVLAPDATHSANDDNSPAINLAIQILAQRDSGPRLNRNLLVFTAAAANRLTELRSAARLLLAWQSIVDDNVALGLTAHQKTQAVSKVTETALQVDSLIAETFTQVLTPTQEPGTADIKWQTTRATASGDIGVRVSKKLATEEKLIAVYGGVRVKMDIDRYDLWSDRHDIAVGELWATYARFPHMPRVASFQALANAISDGTANLNWAQETFGYADAHNDTTWVGVRIGEHLTPGVSGLLIHPEHVPDAEGDDDEDDEDDEGGGGGKKPPPPGAAKHQFYAQFDLDPVRSIKQLGEILEHVGGKLGSELEISLEVRAKNAEGFDDRTRRTVSENAKNLGAKAAEFE